jgi:hypothetical protein
MFLTLSTPPCTFAQLSLQNKKSPLLDLPTGVAKGMTGVAFV